MDADRFAHLVRTLLTTPSRRAVMRGLAALVAGTILTPLFGAETEAAKRRGHERGEQVQDERKKGKKKKLCANAGQTPSKKRKRCCRGLVRDGSGSCAQAPS